MIGQYGERNAVWMSAAASFGGALRDSPKNGCEGDYNAPRERRRRKHLGGSGGMLPQEIFKIEYSETPFPAFLEPRKQFPRQCWHSLKFSLKSKLLNKNG